MEEAQDIDLRAVAQDVAARVGQQLPAIILELLEGGFNLGREPLQLQCSLASNSGGGGSTTRLKVASVDIDDRLLTLSPSPGYVEPSDDDGLTGLAPSRGSMGVNAFDTQTKLLTPIASQDDSESPPAKRRRATGGLRIASMQHDADTSTAVTQRPIGQVRGSQHRKKRLTDNPALRPSTLEKFISSVWESIYSGVKLDPTEVIEQWQAIEGNGQPKLLTDTEQEIALRKASAIQGVFGRMNVLTRKISQASRTCRSLEIIVQTYWVQCFDNRVAELATSMSPEKAKKCAIAEACVDFNWSEKELRNKMGIWRGYHELREAGGWASLVFAGAGLYRLCKYRVDFHEGTFRTLRSLRHRIEVAADTLHPRWRQLLGIVGEPTERRYTGHPLDWVVCGPGDKAIPLPQTYHQWDKDFSYTHLDESAVDEDVWGDFDPRMVGSVDSTNDYKCPVCSEAQSDDPKHNQCSCFPELYGSTKVRTAPVQIYRTPNGKNNGLIACRPIEKGAAVGEFVGQITSGLSNTDVMVGQTERATYQIWQGRMGNYLRFINHSCEPNSEFERFEWLGLQRIVLVSKGIEAGEEITMDYSDTYWEVSVAHEQDDVSLITSRISTKSVYVVDRNAATATGTDIF